MHGHNKRRKLQGRTPSAATTTVNGRKVHTSHKSRSLQRRRLSVPVVAGAPLTTSLTPPTTLIQHQSRCTIVLQTEIQDQSNQFDHQDQQQQPPLVSTPITTKLSTPLHALVSHATFQPHRDLFTTSKRRMSIDLKWKLESILPAPLLNFASALSSSPRLHSYGQTDKVRKKKPSGSGSGGSENNNNNDSDDDDDNNTKKKSLRKPAEQDATKADQNGHKNDASVDQKQLEEKAANSSSESHSDDSKVDTQDKPKVNKFKDPNVLGSIFNISKDEIDRLSAPSDEDYLKKKKKASIDDNSDDATKSKKKKSSKKSHDDSDADKKKKGDKGGDKDDDSPSDEALEKLLKKGKGDKKEKGDDDDDDNDEGPELSPRMQMGLKIYRKVFQAVIATIGVASFLSTFKHSSLVIAAQKGSYDEFRQYLSSGLLESISVYKDNLAVAKFLTKLPETVPGPNGVEIPNPASIPPGFPTEYPFKVLDLSVFARQLDADVAQFGIPGANIIHATSFGLGSALEAMIWLTLFYFLSRKAINHELGWWNDKPLPWLKKLGGAGMRGLLGKAKVWKVVKNLPTRFSDVAGMDESKQEIVEFVDFLKNPDKYHQVGAKLPKGALLHGPPGTGKTLLAKAVAGEAGVPFISCSGSEFVQTYVGMGAKRVRELFAQARKNAPCIIFIDEVDAIARKRDSAGNHDEKEATLNQLLVEMDGFAQNEKIIVLAATNRLDMLDKAFIRPGRIDRKILVDTPDRHGRKEVFKVHLQKVVHSYDPDELGAKLAALTPGLSGADISNICNEAAIFAARENKSTIELVDFEQAIDRVIAGLKRQRASHDLDNERKIVAYHESGHAVAGWFLEHSDPLLKVTITPRTNGALGFAQYMPKQSGIRQTEELYDRICVSLGGRVAEEIFFQKISSGASDDLRKVTNMAHNIVVEWGMSPKMPNVVFPTSQSGSNPTKPMSDRTSEMIDEEVMRIVSTQYERVKKLLIEKKPQLEVLSETLLKEETINHDTIVKVLGPRPFQNDEYLEFMKQSKKQLTPQEKALLGLDKDQSETTTTTVTPSTSSSTPTTPSDAVVETVPEAAVSEPTPGTAPAPNDPTTNTATPAPTPADEQLAVLPQPTDTSGSSDTKSIDHDSKQQ